MESVDSEKISKNNKSKSSEFAGWGMLSRVRPELFGCAMIGIVIFHLCEDIIRHCAKNSSRYKFAKLYEILIGSSGVEIFIILSGVGLCFALHKNGNIRQFYRKRLIRIIPGYIICGSVLCMVRDLVLNKEAVSDVLKDFFFVTFFTKGIRTLWFVLFIIIMYLVYPVLFRVFKYADGKEKSRREKRKKAIIAAVIITLLYFMLYLMKKKSPVLYWNIEIALTRVPIFVYGAYLGEKVYRKKMISFWDFMIPVAGVILKMINSVDKADGHIDKNWWFNGRLIVFLYSVAIILFLAVLLDMLRAGDHLGFLRGFLRLIGKYSLEIYMTHVVIRALMLKKWGFKKYLSRYWLYLLTVVAAVFVVRLITNIVVRAVGQNDKKTGKVSGRASGKTEQ